MCSGRSLGKHRQHKYRWVDLLRSAGRKGDGEGSQGEQDFPLVPCATDASHTSSLQRQMHQLLDQMLVSSFWRALAARGPVSNVLSLLVLGRFILLIFIEFVFVNTRDPR